MEDRCVIGMVPDGEVNSRSSCSEVPSPPPPPPLSCDLNGIPIPPFHLTPPSWLLPGQIDVTSENMSSEQVVETPTGFAELPSDCLLQICFFLKREGLLVASEICQRWNQAATSDDIWRRNYLSSVKYYPAYNTERLFFTMTEHDVRMSPGTSIKGRCISKYGFIPIKTRDKPVNSFREAYITAMSSLVHDAETAITKICVEYDRRAKLINKMDWIVDKVVAVVWIFILLGAMLLSTTGTVLLLLEYAVDQQNRVSMRETAMQTFAASLALFFFVGISYSASSYRLRLHWDDSVRKRLQGVSQKDSCFMNPHRVPGTNTIVYFGYWLSIVFIFLNIKAEGVVPWIATISPMLLSNGFFLLRTICCAPGMFRFFYHLFHEELWIASPGTRDAGYGATFAAVGIPFWLQFLLVALQYDSPGFMPCQASRFPTYGLVFFLFVVLVVCTSVGISVRNRFQRLWHAFTCLTALYITALLTYYSCENGFVALSLLTLSMIALSVNTWWMTSIYVEEQAS